MGGFYYPIPCLILSTGKDRKTPQRYPDVPTTSWRISIQSMDSFQVVPTTLSSALKILNKPSLNTHPHVPMKRKVSGGIDAGEQEVEYFDIFPTKSELAYHRHVHVEKAYIDLNSPLIIKTRMMYNCIMRRKLDPRENANGGVSNFTRRIKGMCVFIGNFTYVADFMVIEDISSIIDPRLSQVVLGRPFIEVTNMTHDISKGVVRFTNGYDEVANKMPHKIEQYDSLSDLEKEHTKLIYLRNKEDKRRGVEYVLSKILVFYKECLELGPEYLTGVDNEGELT
uniref:Retrotransposon Orf1 n=1 Tax=Tanacetum cinerariifolium TaxID=118510 RepID=A0A6L2J168_TANCI|nr:retrotransposon Orf1 [Tanacetum cinerariifolium]